MHVIRLVKDLKMIGVEAIALDDQHYPKRAHYHRDYQEHIIPRDEALDKIRWAKKTAGDDMFLIARTDSFRTDGAAEGIRRCRDYLEAGADCVAVFPNTLEEAREIPSNVKGPVWYANTRGNRVGRPVLTPLQAQEFGYAALGDGHVLFFAAFAAMEARAAGYSFEKSWPDIGDEMTIRNRVEKVLNLEEAYEVEAKTVEKRG
jgi:methylisocitrate lyase